MAEDELLDCKSADTLIVLNHRLGEYIDQKQIDKEKYQRLVCKLIYLSHIRHDIAYVVSVVSQFMHAPSNRHMKAVIRNFLYLKSLLGKYLLLSRNNHFKSEGYIDVD